MNRVLVVVILAVVVVAVITACSNDLNSTKTGLTGNDSTKTDAEKTDSAETDFAETDTVETDFVGTDSGEAVEMDGGGSYVEVIAGTVNAVSDIDEDGYVFLLQLDEESARLLQTEEVKVQMYYDWQHKKEDTFEEGMFVNVGYMNGSIQNGEIPLIDGVNWAAEMPVE